MVKRVYFVAHGGLVQGVGYRYFTRERARELGITGWCRNTVDDKVEGEAQGEEEQMSKFMGYLKQGPSHANVAELTQEPRDVISEEGFNVTR